MAHKNFAKTWLVLAFWLGSAGAWAMPNQQDAEGWYRQIETQNPSAKDALTKAERERLLELVSDNPVASLDKVEDYDPDGQIGFCFGRGMTAHLIARQMGLKADSIHKLFIIGDLRQGPNPEWRFHTTTIVKGSEDGQWYAIDPIMLPPISTGKPLLAGDWIATVRKVWDQKTDSSQLAHVYFVNNDSILPDERLFPATAQDETGDRIIELSFRPDGKPGFTKTPMGNDFVYQVDPTREQQQFLGFRDFNSLNPFDFLGLVVVTLSQGVRTPQTFQYNAYFTDLLQNLIHNPAKPEVKAMAEAKAARPVRTLDRYKGKNLLSFRLPVR